MAPSLWTRIFRKRGIPAVQQTQQHLAGEESPGLGLGQMENPQLLQVPARHSWIESLQRSYSAGLDARELRDFPIDSPLPPQASLLDPMTRTTVHLNGDELAWYQPGPESAHFEAQHTPPTSRMFAFPSPEPVPGSPSVHTLNAPVLRGSSTLAQTTFNSINLFIGVGLLSIPYTFRIAGFVLGPLMIIACALLSMFSTRILIRAMDSRPGIRTYSDLGEAAFGKLGRWFITAVFFLELFACGCAYIVLIGDTLVQAFPEGLGFVPGGREIGLVGWKALAFVLVLLPTTVMGSLRFLSSASILGIVASLFLGVVLVVDACLKPTAPGSIYEPAPVDMFPTSLRNWLLLPLNLGIVMYNYSGGAVMPNLYRDMAQPSQFYRMLRITFAVVTTWFLFMSGLGYWMFGRETEEEITFNIAKEPFYNRVLTQVLLWLIVLNPLTKFALMLNPICSNLELSLVRPLVLWWTRTKSGDHEEDAQQTIHSEDDQHPPQSEDQQPLLVTPGSQLKHHQHQRERTLYQTGQVILRTTIASLSFIVAVYFPSFNGLLSLIGTVFSFLVSAIFPSLAFLWLFQGQLHWRTRMIHWSVIGLSTLMVLAGMVWQPIFDYIAPESGEQ